MENIENNACIGHPVTNLLMQQAATTPAPECGACPGDGSICAEACRLAEESPAVDVLAVQVEPATPEDVARRLNAIEANIAILLARVGAA